MPREPKLQRWTDLIAALLRRRYPVTFEELARDVPAYSGNRRHDAVMRMFERDKDELRSFGIAIETVPFDDDEGEASGYRLDRKGFYLPYLSLAAREGGKGSQPRKTDRYGYRSLASLVIEPDELAIIARAGVRVRALGDPVLTQEVESALRKLSFDLPIAELAEPDDESAMLMSRMSPMSSGVRGQALSYPAPIPAQDIFEVLNDALRRRKTVRFDYHSIGAGQASSRSVEPYGLFFLSSHWYLAARDTEKDEMRNFRLNRIQNLELNRSRSQTADYSIPSGFNLRKHSGSRQAWELGDGGSEDAVVEFRNPAGAAKAAARLGVAVEGTGDLRKFQFRRLDTFARWLLSFGGEAIPREPPHLVKEFERQASETSALYEEAG
jgi:predicted DNA-binding transcriptional regulator YafY